MTEQVQGDRRGGEAALMFIMFMYKYTAFCISEGMFAYE